MSKFFTPIAVNISEVKAALPDGAHVEHVKFNAETGCVEVHWDLPKFVTPHDFPTKFPLTNLQAQKLPEGVGFRRKVVKLPPRAPVTSDDLELQGPKGPVPIEKLDPEAAALAKAEAEKAAPPATEANEGAAPATEAGEAATAALAEPAPEPQPEPEPKAPGEAASVRTQPANARDKAGGNKAKAKSAK